MVILPTIAKNLGISETNEQWIVTAYAVVFACFLLVWGSVADIYGKKKVFILGSAWVAATTAVNPFIKNEVGFCLMRGLQGLVRICPRSRTEALPGYELNRASRGLLQMFQRLLESWVPLSRLER